MRKIIIGILLFSMNFTGCSIIQNNSTTGPDTKEKVLVVSVPKLPVTLNPINSISAYDIMVFSQLSEPLLRYDSKTMEPIAGIAKSWDVRDGKVYTFHLNSNVYFSDGKHFTAEDFKYSYEKYLTPEFALSYLLDGISGATEKLAGKTKETKGIKVLDDHTLEITLDRPDSNFLSKLGSPILVVLNRKEVEQMGQNFGQNGIVGVGPFKLTRRTPNEIELVRNVSYYGKKPYVDRVKFIELSSKQAWKEYKKGNIDLMFYIPDAKNVINDPAYKNNIRLIPDLSSIYICLNLNKEPLKSNLKLRQAIGYAIDKERIVSQALDDEFGTAANTLVPPLLSGRPKDVVFNFNREKARELLAGAGYPNGRGLRELNLTYHDRISQKRIVESIKKDLAVVGIQVKLIHADESQALPMVKGVTDLFRDSWGPDYLDLSSYIEPLFSSRGYSNISGYKNKEVDDLVERSQKIQSFIERKRLLTEAENIALKEYPVIPLYWGQYTTVTSDRVKNLQISPHGLPVFESIVIEN